MEDSAIVDLYWSRQEEAALLTQEKYGDYCMQIAMRILGDREDAQECVNDTYTAAWDSIPPNHPENLKTYLGKLTRRIGMKRWRSRDAQKRGGGEIALSLEELGECVASGISLEDQLSGKELTQILNAFLRKLPKQQRQIFVLRYWYGCSIREICGKFGFSKSKVESMLHRTRNKLRETLKEEGYFD